MISGFLVFLLALPLSLGIASASDFPPIYGLITAMVGGVLVSFISGSALTIKGPAAGLIVIVAGSVAEFSKFAPSHVDAAQYGWHLALGAVVVAGILQVLFGVLKLGKLSDLFPISAVHGMLAAIGIIIMSKQVHILLGFNPMTAEGKPMVEPLELILEFKNTLLHIFAHKEVDIVGFTSLIIVFGWPLLPVPALKKIPSAVIVLLVAIPMGMYLDLHNVADVKNATGQVLTKGYKPLLDFDKGLVDVLGVNVSFEGFNHLGSFLKYVIMFALVGSLEALLTVKAIDFLDPWKRKSNPNKELVALGIGNIVAGILGGLPMISEVARSSANVSNGGKTRWSNFFHGIFILLFLIFAIYFSYLIPKTALAAMLIGVGLKLAHPREFGHMFAIGTDQFAIFIVTILLTLSTDLLVGIGAGILLKILLHLFRGAKLKHIFQSMTHTEDKTIFIRGAAVFSNFTKTKEKIEGLGFDKHVIVNVEDCSFIDYSVMESLQILGEEFKTKGGMMEVVGLERFENAGKSTHKHSAKKRIN
ncbi:MAG: SulP family inorganic anion transporter [Flavobacteriales bacterium]